MGAEAEHTLARLAVAQSRRNRRRGLPPGNNLNNMRVQLDGALHTFTALMIASSGLGPPGTATAHMPPVPLPSILIASWPEPGQGPDAVRPQHRCGPVAGPADMGADDDADGLFLPVPRDPIRGFPQFSNLEHQYAFQIGKEAKATMLIEGRDLRKEFPPQRHGETAQARQPVAGAKQEVDPC